MKLIHIETGKEMHEGDHVTTFRGEVRILSSICPDEGKNGKVYVKFEGNTSNRGFYPSVIGCEFKG